MKKIIIVLGLCCFMFIGCELFDVKEDGMTNIEGYLTQTGDMLKDVGGIVPYPGAGLIGTGVAALLGLIGHSITSVVISRRRKSALSTVIKGVEIGAENFDKIKESVVSIVSGIPNESLKLNIEKVFEDAKSIKETIAGISGILNTSNLLDKYVQVETKK